MTTSEVLACSREIVRAKQARDAAVALLDLDHKPDPWADMYTTPEADDEPE